MYSSTENFRTAHQLPTTGILFKPQTPDTIATKITYSDGGRSKPVFTARPSRAATATERRNIQSCMAAWRQRLEIVQRGSRRTSRRENRRWNNLMSKPQHLRSSRELFHSTLTEIPSLCQPAIPGKFPSAASIVNNSRSRLDQPKQATKLPFAAQSKDQPSYESLEIPTIQDLSRIKRSRRLFNPPSCLKDYA